MPKVNVPDLRAVLATAKGAALNAAEDQVRAYAHRLREEFVTRIKAQDFQSFRRVPLSWRWQQRKASMRLDARTMIATSEYVNSIQVYETRAKGQLQVRIGIHPSKSVRSPRTFTRRRIPMWLLACVHEFGSSAAKVPARPHWGPFFLETAAEGAPREARSMVQAMGRKVHAAVGVST